MSESLEDLGTSEIAGKQMNQKHFFFTFSKTQVWRAIGNEKFSGDGFVSKNLWKKLPILRPFLIQVGAVSIFAFVAGLYRHKCLARETIFGNKFISLKISNNKRLA